MNVHCLLDFRLHVFVKRSVLTRAVAQVCKIDFIGWNILFYSCARFPFLSASSFSFFPPAGASLLLPVGNKLSCWHFLFAFLLCREIPRTPLQFTMEIPHWILTISNMILRSILQPLLKPDIELPNQPREEHVQNLLSIICRELSLSSPAYHMFSWKGEAKEQDISAGPGSRKQRKQGNESFKNQLQFSNH